MLSVVCVRLFAEFVLLIGHLFKDHIFSSILCGSYVTLEIEDTKTFWGSQQCRD